MTLCITNRTLLQLWSKSNTTVKMSYLNVPFQNMQHFVQIPEISEMASRQFGSDIYVILFSFWHVFEVHYQCLIFFFFLFFSFWKSVSLFFMLCSIFISVESFFSSHMSFDLYIPPLALKPSLFPPPQQSCHSTTSRCIWEWHWVIGKIAKKPSAVIGFWLMLVLHLKQKMFYFTPLFRI